MFTMLHAVVLNNTTEEGVMISSGRISWALAVGTNVLIWVYLVFLLLTLTMLLLNTLPVRLIIMHYSVIFLKRLLITILIQFQPEHHKRELGEVHCLYLLENVWQHISSKHEKKDDYRIVDSLLTIRKEGT